MTYRDNHCDECGEELWGSAPVGGLCQECRRARDRECLEDSYPDDMLGDGDPGEP